MIFAAKQNGCVDSNNTTAPKRRDEATPSLVRSTPADQDSQDSRPLTKIRGRASIDMATTLLPKLSHLVDPYRWYWYLLILYHNNVPTFPRATCRGTGERACYRMYMSCTLTLIQPICMCALLAKEFKCVASYGSVSSKGTGLHIIKLLAS